MTSTTKDTEISGRVEETHLFTTIKEFRLVYGWGTRQKGRERRDALYGEGTREVGYFHLILVRLKTHG